MKDYSKLQRKNAEDRKHWKEFVCLLYT